MVILSVFFPVFDHSAHKNKDSRRIEFVTTNEEEERERKYIFMIVDVEEDLSKLSN